jgi:holliday junction DNA helicase RuvA
MIASVTGAVLVRRPDYVVIEAAGVGYRLAVSAETLRSVPARGKQATLHSHLVVRDDQMSLYGFASEDEHDLFLMLISVSGVGPKVALAALSGGPVRELLSAIAAGDGKRFQAVPGIGKRTSERIIVELREKVAGELEADATESADGAEAPPRSQAREGLLNLGYTPAEAEKLLDSVAGDSAEELIQAALRFAAGAAEAA